DSASGQPVGNLLTTHPAEMGVLYATHYHRLDPWRGPIIDRPLGQPVRGSQLIDDRDLARGAYYNEFGQQIGTFHMLAVVAPLKRQAGSPLFALTLHRAKKFEPFEAAAIQRLCLLMPHVRRSMQLRDTLQPAKVTLAASLVEAMLEEIPEAAFVCDPQGRVLHVNDRAKVADQAGVINLRSRESTRAVATQTTEWTRQLHSLIASAGRSEAGGVTRVASSAFAMVAPLTPALTERFGLPRGRVLVLIRGLPAPLRSLTNDVRTLLHFTEAEAEVACGLAGGSSPNEIAADRGVRVSTIRTLLERAMSKAGVDNLRHLTALLATISR
ncbi:MAG TPA: hypothetical protein VHX39_37370, partial [Acetobacteraceae bacterium]|nr:hypothetical protein [Acetobacteraceae bacterium]